MATSQPGLKRLCLEQLVRLLRAVGYTSLCLAPVGLCLFLGTIASFCHSSEVRLDWARRDIHFFGHALQRYQAMTGRYPTTEEGLRALLPYQLLQQISWDPWGNEYHYLLWRGCPVIWSYGRDGAPGGDEWDADICNMGSSPPAWIIQQASQVPPLPPPPLCPWSPKSDCIPGI